ncbi:MAG: hydrogenase expression/formation protein HypE [Candidatus Marinimicrobia bacterium]|nr:hydrogenase expression/formation protein HypE [Candidatus Neomarinimicrobiota bacterium]
MIDIPEALSCPVPIMRHDTIQLAHGSGGKLSSELIDKLIIPRFTNKTLDKLEDQAILDIPGGKIAFSTDTFVVDPIFFPGGNIGELAINGTVNDVAMSGAKPIALSVGFVLEEGLPLETLHRILLSMEEAAKIAGVQIVTGDTKVVSRGSCDKIFINTSGIGLVPDGVNIDMSQIKTGDKIILSGTIADHGMAVLTTRKGLSFQSRVKSDTAALNGLVDTILNVTKDVHAMRDPTRGGVATTLNEFAKQTQLGICIREDRIPVEPDVKGACEVLGIDPLYVANEGKLICVVPHEHAESVLAAMRRHPLGRQSVILGEVVNDHPGMVTMKSLLGAKRIIDMPIGEQLPRIC